MNVGGELEEIDVLGYVLDRFDKPLGQRSARPAASAASAATRAAPTSQGLLTNASSQKLDRVGVVPLRLRRLGPHQERLILGPDQHSDLARDRR